jgi:hypothetical protein
MSKVLGNAKDGEGGMIGSVVNFPINFSMSSINSNLLIDLTMKVLINH